MPYPDFFSRVCGFDPYPFQVRFHESKAEFRILEVPTGLGKTNTVLADWLHDRLTTRLVYCLPGRALTRQTAEIARRMAPADVQVFELMGGSEDLHERIRPDQPAILIGTQDVLLSRALNRGYALSPFRWPMDFGLLNNDVTWVFDEVQLLGEAVATGAQLAAFRKQFGAFGQARCVWMTATFERTWLDTVDFREKPTAIWLEADDLANERVQQRVDAAKSIAETKNCDSPADCAAFVKSEHQDQPGFLTLVVTNTVARAQEIWAELKKLKIDSKLLHSRFRPCDRTKAVNEILKTAGGIIVATQVIEAGVDMNADLMVTDACPWSSIVQRAGRVNRDGRKPHARIYWVRNPQRSKKPKLDGSQHKPYDAAEVEKAIVALEGITSAAPKELAGKVEAPAPYRYVLRRSDLLDLFDTTPDLAGNQLDVSRFVRSGEETNVYIAWREWPEKVEPESWAFASEELCPVPFFPGKSDFKEWLKKHDAWTWNYIGKGRWERVDPERVYAGMRLLVRSEAGGYDPDRGWFPDSKITVTPYSHVPQQQEGSMDSDLLSITEARGLAAHSDDVVSELGRLLAALPVELNGEKHALQRAARLHDWGKAHPVFQQTLHKHDWDGTRPEPLLAKQSRENSRGQHSRVGFRHELASALAALERGEEFLTAYLDAAHHGKVRANIRSIEGETPARPDGRIARGVEDGDQLYAADLGGGEHAPSMVLDLAAMELGGNGWCNQVLGLLEQHGPFRLAYLELLLRAADERASEEGGQ